MADERKNDNLDARGAAKILDVTERRVLQMIREGTLKATKHPYWNKWVIKRQDVEDLRQLREF